MEAPQKNARILIIDALRGFALAGVALVHMVEQYVAGAPPEGMMESLGTPDYIVFGILQLFFQGKFFALFSILFGLSFYLQMDSAAKKGEDFSIRFLWRAFLLFLIGYVHQLFYRGDILTIYAMLVPFLIPFHRVNKKWILLVAGLIFLSIPRFIAYAAFGNDPLFGLPNDFDNALNDTYLETIKSGSIIEVFQQNGWYGMATKMDFQLRFMGRFYFTLGYFLLGLWIGKMELFRRIPEVLPFIKKVLVGSAIGLGVAIIFSGIAFTIAPKPVDMSHWQHVLLNNFGDWFNISMTLVIISVFVLIYQNAWWEKALNFFAPYGRMALTNYLMQSIIGTFLFFGWGLGLLGELRPIHTFPLAIVLITLQSIFSKYWLKHFKYGPLEWLWRSATYFKWQKFRK